MLHQLLYNAGFTTGFSLTWPYFTYRMWKRGRLWAAFSERLGWYAPEAREWMERNPRPIWIHAVSVGEMMIARAVLAELRPMLPGVKVVLSTTTATGRQVGQTLVDENTLLIYNPTDFLLSVKRAFDQIQPLMLILVEQEIWPNYIWCAERREVPVWLINARLSDRSMRRFCRFRYFVEPVVRLIGWVGLQHPEDVERLARAGFRPETLAVTGSMKFDVAEAASYKTDLADEIRAQLGWSEEEPVLLAGSTHPGEEDLFVEMFLAMRREFPRLRLVLAPRHFERAGGVLKSCQEHGLKTVLRSELKTGEILSPSPDVMVLNTTGELSSLYKLGSLNFIGKSILGKGGQNFIEAVRWGRPVIVGPFMDNFRSLVSTFRREGGVVQVENTFELFQTFRELLLDPERARRIGEAGKKTYQENLGAGRRTAEMILAAAKKLQSKR